MLPLPYSVIFRSLAVVVFYNRSLFFQPSNYFVSITVITVSIWPILSSSPPLSPAQFCRLLEKGRKRRKQPQEENLCARGGKQAHPLLCLTIPFHSPESLHLYCIVSEVQQSLNLYSFLAKQYNLGPYLTSQSPNVLIFRCEDSDSMKRA